MNDDRLGRVAAAWLHDTDLPAADPGGIVAAAMTAIPDLPQARASGLRARLEREVVPVPGTARPASDRPVVRGNDRMFATLRFAMAAIVLVLVGGLLAVLTQPSLERTVPLEPAVGTASPGPTASTAVSENTSDGTFELTISSPKATWTVDEPIDVSATFTYVGEEQQKTIFATGGGPVGFWFEQLDGSLTNVDRLVGDTSCGSHTYVRGEPEEVPFRKSGMVGSRDPDRAFWRAWLKDPEFHLPVGTYRISAGASYGLSGCDETQLGAAITIAVVESGEATPEASGSPIPSAIGWGPLAVISEGGASDAGLGPGTLSIGPDCVTFHGDRSPDDIGITLVWPSDQTRWLPPDQQIVFEDPIDGTFQLSDGDHVTFGGQGLGGDSPKVAEQVAAWLEGVWVQRPDSSCPGGLWHVGEVQMVPRVELVDPEGRIPGKSAAVRAEKVVAKRADYAGLYVDAKRDGLPVYLFTGDLDSAIEQLRESLGEDATFEVREVERSSSDLDAIGQAILDADEELRQQGIDIVEVGTDIRRNQVVVGVLGKIDLASNLLSDHADASAFRVEKTGRPQAG